MRSLSVALNLEDLHVEDEGGAARDLGTGATTAITEIGGDVHLPAITFNHILHGFSPTLDNLVGSEGDGGAAVARRVELGSIDEGTGVVHLARRALGRGHFAGTLDQSLDAQSRAEAMNTGLRLFGGPPGVIVRGAGDEGDAGCEKNLEHDDVDGGEQQQLFLLFVSRSGVCVCVFAANREE